MEGEHVRLRRIERSDLPAIHRWMNDADVMAWTRFSADHMISAGQLEKEFEKDLAGDDQESVRYLIEERASGASGTPIGWCRIGTWDKKHVTANVGIALGEKNLWGKGYGTEAMRLLLSIVFDYQGWHRADLWTLAENERAIKSFEKVGFRLEGRERESAFYGGRYHDVVLMGLLKPEWDARKAT
jgi:RimJ/RimL family protein N-acetyltransferase